MHVYGSTYVHGPQSINAPHRAASPQPTDGATKTTTGADQLDISSEANFVSKARDLPENRADRVAEIRQAIAEGTYETDEKLNVALDRLLDEIAG
jgi:negative regulator of flagellin synthesis FlgM